jgi:tetratricopeptide (TPR) repeat protein
VHSPEVTRAYNNLGFSLLRLGDVRRSSEVAVEGARAAERFGVAEWVRWARDKVLYADFYGGRWDEALSESEALLAEVGGSGHYLVSSWQTLRGHILLARGDEAAAVESATIAIEQARIAGDPQVVAPALAWRARVLAASGERDSAADAIEQLAGLIGTPSASIWFTDAVAALLELGRPDDFERLAKLVPITTRWLVAGRAQAGPDPAKAADLYAEMGALPDEADARLHAAHRLVGEGRRGQADAQLGRALAFYRRVRAARYARDAEALLAESA